MSSEQGAAKGHNIGLIIVAIAVLLLLAALDQTIVSTALPTIVSDLGGLDHLSWVVTAYLLTSTVSSPLYGKLGDLYGRKVMMQVSVTIFLVGSALCGLSTSMGFLIGARALQGLGGGGLFVLAFTLVGDLIPPKDRGKLQGVFGGVFSLSSVMGPLLGGFFVDNLSWHWIFYINLPLGIAALAVFAFAFKPRGIRVSHKIDYLGALLLTVTLSSIVLFTSLGGRTFPWGSPFILTMIGLAIVCAIAFVFVELAADEPVLPMTLFRYNAFTVMGMAGFITGVAMFGAITFMPVYLQVAKGISPTMSGLMLVPMTLGILSGSILAGNVMSRTGRYKLTPIIGAVALFIGMMLLTTLEPDTNSWLVSLYIMIMGFGLGPVMSVGLTAIQNAVPREMMGVGTAGFTLFRQIGGSLGVAAFGAVFSHFLAENLGGLMPVSSDGEMPTLNAQMVKSLPPGIRETVLDAFTGALHPVFMLGAAAAVMAFIIGFFLHEVPLKNRGHSDEVAPEPTL